MLAVHLHHIGSLLRTNGIILERQQDKTAVIKMLIVMSSPEVQVDGTMETLFIIRGIRTIQMVHCMALLVFMT